MLSWLKEKNEKRKLIKELEDKYRDYKNAITDNFGKLYEMVILTDVIKVLESETSEELDKLYSDLKFGNDHIRPLENIFEVKEEQFQAKDNKFYLYLNIRQYLLKNEFTLEQYKEVLTVYQKSVKNCDEAELELNKLRFS